MSQGPVGPQSDVYSRYGLNRHSEVQTAQEIQQRVRQEYEQQYGGLLGRLIATLQAPVEVADVLDAQAARLKGQVLTRDAPPPPDANYLGISHQQLYDGVNNGVDPGVVGEMGDIWANLGNQLARFNEAIGNAIGVSEADWTGQAGDAARQALADMGNRAGETGTAAQLAGTLFAQQSRALSTARASVPPPPAEPFDAGAAHDRLMTITDPVAFARQAAADRAVFEQQREAHREAARAVEAYDRTTAQTAAAQPAFAPAPETPPPPKPQPENPSTPIARDPNPRGAVLPPPVGTPTDTGPAGTTGTSWSGPPVGPGTGTTTPSGVGNPANPATPGTGGTTGGGSSSGGGPVLGGGGPVTVPRSGDRGDRKAGGATGVGGGGRGGSGAGRPPGGFGAGAAGGSGGPGAGLGPGGGAAARGLAGGGSSGLLPHGDAQTGRVGGGGAAGGRGAGAGAGMMGGVGPAGAGRGQGDEDIERNAPSYLLEPDPNEIFGDDRMVAPPTIGE